jgi:cytochrome c oxidase assembly factor 1
VDVSFPIQGSKQSGTVYFTSIRPTKESRFEVFRFTVLAADGQRIELNQDAARQ